MTAKDGWVHVDWLLRIAGPESSFRIKSGNDVDFVVMTSDPESFHLYAFTKNGKNRQAPVEVIKSGFLGRLTKQEVPPMEVDISKYGELSYRIRVKALGLGEYGFATEFNVFDFGVDSK